MSALPDRHAEQQQRHRPDKLPDGVLVLAYNPVGGDAGSRSLLNLAVSFDNGKTWPKTIALENDNPPAEYSYPAIIAHGDRVAVTYDGTGNASFFWEFANDALEAR